MIIGKIFFGFFFYFFKIYIKNRKLKIELWRIYKVLKTQWKINKKIYNTNFNSQYKTIQYNKHETNQNAI